MPMTVVLAIITIRTQFKTHICTTRTSIIYRPEPWLRPRQRP